MSKTKELLANLNKLTDSSGVAPTKAEPKVQSYANRFYTSTPESIHKLPKKYDSAKKRKDEDGDEFIMIDRIYGTRANCYKRTELSIKANFTGKEDLSPVRIPSPKRTKVSTADAQ